MPLKFVPAWNPEGEAVRHLDRIRLEFEFLMKNRLIEGQVSMKSVLLCHPTILSKVIPPFDTKLGSGWLDLRWTTRKSQVQFFEKSAEFD